MLESVPITTPWMRSRRSKHRSRLPNEHKTVGASAQVCYVIDSDVRPIIQKHPTIKEAMFLIVLLRFHNHPQ